MLHLGSFTVNESVSFQVPAGVQSVTIIEQQVNPDAAQAISIQGQPYPNTVFPHSITVNGSQIFDVYTDAINPGCNTQGQNCVALSTLETYYFSQAAWTGAITFPNTATMLSSFAESGGVPSGTWKLVVSDFANECPGIEDCSTVYAYPQSEYDITVLLKQASPGPVISPAGTIDVNFYLLTAEWDGLSEPATTAAANDPDVVHMLSSYRTLLAGAELAVGNVNFYELPAAVKAKYNGTVDATDTSPCGELAELLAYANPGNQMNLFLVDSIKISTSSANIGGFATAVGLDGTIPGPASVGGTVQSGAIVSVADLSQSGPTACSSPTYFNECGYEKVAYIAAHETGHFLGLYHPTEFDGTWFDPLGDPQCPCSTCAPSGSECQNSAGTASSPYAMQGSDCTSSSSCQGGDHLMFWLLSDVSQGMLYPAEGQVMRANPLVH
jgi:hypothetical protein